MKVFKHNHVLKLNLNIYQNEKIPEKFKFKRSLKIIFQVKSNEYPHYYSQNKANHYRA